MAITHHRRQRRAVFPLFMLTVLAGCGSTGDHVEVTVEQPTSAAGEPTPSPFPFSGVETAFVGVSGSYPYMLLYEDSFACEALTVDSGAAISDVTYDNILILVGGWEEGEYPIFDVLGATGPYSIEGQAIAYMATRTGLTIEALEYARGGSLEVERISQALQTVKGRFRLEFETGTLTGEFSISELCDVY